MLWIGRSGSGEDAWLAWAPNNNTEENDEEVGVGSGKEDTTLGEKQYRKTDVSR
jgi:hypothetical protein